MEMAVYSNGPRAHERAEEDDFAFECVQKTFAVFYRHDKNVVGCCECSRSRIERVGLARPCGWWPALCRPSLGKCCGGPGRTATRAKKLRTATKHLTKRQVYKNGHSSSSTTGGRSLRMQRASLHIAMYRRPFDLYGSFSAGTQGEEWTYEDRSIVL
jgi:hypothetical protein